jgi:hypothetical protein
MWKRGEGGDWRKRYNDLFASINGGLKSLGDGLKALTIDVEKSLNGFLGLEADAAALDGIDGSLHVGFNQTRRMSRKVTVYGHDLEIALSPRFFGAASELDTLRVPDPPINENSGPNILLQVEPYDVASLSFDPSSTGDSCRALGLDQVGICQSENFDSMLLDQHPVPADIWIAVALSASGLSVTAALARGGRLCGAVGPLAPLEAATPLRLDIQQAVQEAANREIKPVDLNSYIGNLSDLGITPELYDVRIGPNVSLFGRVTTMPLRERVV